MRFRLYREYGALNSVPVFNAFEQGIKSIGHESVTENEDVAVIWSVLWSGRMANNQAIYNKCRAENKPIVIIEVGNLKRNETWRISIGNINGAGTFGNQIDLDINRPSKLKLQLKPIKLDRPSEILLATQHNRSLQWEGLPPMSAWAESIIKQVQKYTDRKIIVRPHPRSTFPVAAKNVKVEVPRRILGSYDDYDISYNYHCVINYNSGPAVQAAIDGTPIICNASSLAGELSGTIENIENIKLPDREEWFLKLCHTEWTVPEIRTGIPLSRIIPSILLT